MSEPVLDSHALAQPGTAAWCREVLAQTLLERDGEVICRPWVRDLTITCPAGEVERIEFGSVTEFDAEACDHCTLRAQCTAAAPGTGRTSSTRLAFT